MKKVGLVIVGAIAAAVALSNFGLIIGLAISVAILYYAAKWFVKTTSNGMKVVWGTVAVLAALSAIANVPAILGLLAVYVLYLIYKNWNGTKSKDKTIAGDPFVNFDKQWDEISEKN